MNGLVAFASRTALAAVFITAAAASGFSDALSAAPDATFPTKERTLEFGAFGAVNVYQPSSRPRAVALFVSGDGGWNQGVVDMARELATLDTVVVGIDIRRYLAATQAGQGTCFHAAIDFEALSQYIQKKLALPDYTPPVLVGYSSGATLVYAVLVQAPQGTFAGAVSLGFCPDLPLTKPPCRGEGLAFHAARNGKGVVFDPSPALASPWRVMQGEIDRVCDPASTRAYVAKVPGAKLFALPKVGHGYSVPRNWLGQLKSAFLEVVAVAAVAPGVNDATNAKAASGAGNAGADVPSPEIGDLPLVDVPAQGSPRDVLALILTGDGGWSGMDRQIADALVARGVAVVGWNSLRYYWTPRTPEGAAADLARILEHYLVGRPSHAVLLIGYSLGADVLPFVAARLPENLRARVRLVALIGPSTSASFKFHLSNWLGGKPSDALPTLPEVLKLTRMRLFCLYGKDEKDSLCTELAETQASVEALAGAHHFGGDYEAVARRIIEAAELDPH